MGERSYDIHIGSGILGAVGSKLKPYKPSPKIAIISNPTVYKLCGKVVSDSIKKAGFKPLNVIIPDGEQYKSLLWAEYIWTGLLKAGLDRKSIIIALGGGVIGDIAGFTASTYMRGIRYIQVPTTLLSQVDSSVGGKTGVNHPLGKNMIGTFYQPSLVCIDTDTLKTLPQKEFISGMAEVIKYGVIWDKSLFEFLERQRSAILRLDRKALTHIIRRSCEIKGEVVSRDEKEQGLRAILNYGHTIGHAIETVTGYKRYLHGEAIAIGMCTEADIAGLNSKELSRIKRVIDSYGLPIELPKNIPVEKLLRTMEVDKKALAGELRFILPEEIGSVRIKEVDRERIRKVLP